MEQTWLDEDTALKAAARKGWGFESLLLRHNQTNCSMKNIRIGLTNTKSVSLLHDYCCVSGKGGLSVEGFLVSKEQLIGDNFGKPIYTHTFSDKCVIRVRNGKLIAESPESAADETFSLSNEKMNNDNKLLAVIIIKSASGSVNFSQNQNDLAGKTYIGHLMVVASENSIRAILFHNLEDYVQSVLHGEIPSSYHLEAIKAQAICARTYALNPRVNHAKDFCNVCDSYLCCQCFSEIPSSTNSAYGLASLATEKQILTYQNKPALALFSSSAGGHTENYEDCFSDLENKAFPPLPISYLRGVSEALPENNAQKKVDEQFLRNLWQNHLPNTVDSWGKNFRWLIKLTKQDLEAHLHHNLSQLLKEEDFAPFVVPPPSAIFGEILSVSALKRGVGGTLIAIKIETSKGCWEIKRN